MRLDADVLEWLKGYGKGYQTRVNLLLRHAMANSEETNASANDSQARGKRTRRAHASG